MIVDQGVTQYKKDFEFRFQTLRNTAKLMKNSTALFKRVKLLNISDSTTSITIRNQNLFK